MYENFEFQIRMTEAATSGYLRVQTLRRAVATMAHVLGREWESHGLLGASIDDIVLVDGYDGVVICKGFVADMARVHFPMYRIIEI